MRLNSQPEPSALRSDGDARKAALMRAAAAVFARDGYEAASTRAICAKAGANISAIAYYFGGKQGLFLAVLAQAHAHAAHAPMPQEPANTADPRQSLLSLVSWMLHSSAANQRAGAVSARLMMRAMAAPEPLASKIAVHIGGPIRERLGATLDALTDGALSPVARERALAMTFSLCTAFAHAGPALQRLGVRTPRASADLTELAEAMTNFIIGGLDTLARFDHPQRPARTRKGAR